MTATIRSVRAARLRAGWRVLVESTVPVEITGVTVMTDPPYEGLVLVRLAGRAVPEVFEADERVLVLDDRLPVST